MAMQLGGDSGPSSKKNQNFSASSDINVTPFVDVMLVLLIIFMVAVPLAAVNVKVNFPNSNARPDQAPNAPIYLSMPAPNAIYIGDARYYSVSEVGAQLIKETPANKRDTTRIMLRADSDIQYRYVLDMMNELRASGFYKVALVGHSAIKKQQQ
jgi:biopolymer transport protein ExbD